MLPKKQSYFVASFKDQNSSWCQTQGIFIVISALEVIKMIDSNNVALTND